VHGDGAAAERLRRDQLEPSRARQPALVQGRAVAGDPAMDEEPTTSVGAKAQPTAMAAVMTSGAIAIVGHSNFGIK
jgi:hypothetical protein